MHVWLTAKLTVIGQVDDASGKPVAQATVLVYEAGVRKGYSIYCPTCWTDCGKRAPSASPVDRDKFVELMGLRGVGVGVHYRSVAEYSLYQRLFGWKPSDFPNALRIGQRTVSLPLSAKLTEQDVERVVRAVEGICS